MIYAEGYSEKSKEFARKRIEHIKEDDRRALKVRKQKVKELSKQTNSFRRKLENKKELQEKEEEERRQKILKTRRLKQQTATEKFQRKPENSNNQRGKHNRQRSNYGLQDGKYNVRGHVIEIRNGIRINSEKSKQTTDDNSLNSGPLNMSPIFQNSIYSPNTYLTSHLGNLLGNDTAHINIKPNLKSVAAEAVENRIQNDQKDEYHFGAILHNNIQKIPQQEFQQQNINSQPNNQINQNIINVQSSPPLSPTGSVCSNDSLNDHENSNRSSIKGSVLRKNFESRKVTFSSSIEFNDGRTKPLEIKKADRVPLYKRMQSNDNRTSAEGNNTILNTEDMLDQLRQEALLPRYPVNGDFSYPDSVDDIYISTSNVTAVLPTVSPAQTQIDSGNSSSFSQAQSISSTSVYTDSRNSLSTKDSLDIAQQQHSSLQSDEEFPDSLVEDGKILKAKQFDSDNKDMIESCTVTSSASIAPQFNNVYSIQNSSPAVQPNNMISTISSPFLAHQISTTDCTSYSNTSAMSVGLLNNPHQHSSGNQTPISHDNLGRNLSNYKADPVFQSYDNQIYAQELSNYGFSGQIQPVYLNPHYTERRTNDTVHAMATEIGTIQNYNQSVNTTRDLNLNSMNQYNILSSSTATTYPPNIFPQDVSAYSTSRLYSNIQPGSNTSDVGFLDVTSQYNPNQIKPLYSTIYNPVSYNLSSMNQVPRMQEHLTNDSIATMGAHPRQSVTQDTLEQNLSNQAATSNVPRTYSYSKNVVFESPGCYTKSTMNQIDNRQNASQSSSHIYIHPISANEDPQMNNKQYQEMNNNSPIQEACSYTKKNKPDKAKLQSNLRKKNQDVKPEKPNQEKTSNKQKQFFANQTSEESRNFSESDDIYNEVEKNLAGLTFKNSRNVVTMKQKQTRPNNFPGGDLSSYETTLEQEKCANKVKNNKISDTAGERSSIPIRVHSNPSRHGRIIVSADSKKRKPAGGLTPHPPVNPKTEKVNTDEKIRENKTIIIIREKPEKSEDIPTVHRRANSANAIISRKPPQPARKQRPHSNSNFVHAHNDPIPSYQGHNPYNSLNNQLLNIQQQIPLDKTPTDDEINKLWANVRQCLSTETPDQAYSDSACVVDNNPFRHHQRTASGSSFTRRSIHKPPFHRQTSNDSISSTSSYTKRQVLLPQRANKLFQNALSSNASRRNNIRFPQQQQHLDGYWQANQRKGNQSMNKYRDVTASMASFLTLEEMCKKQSLTPKQAEAVFQTSKQMRQQSLDNRPGVTALSLEERCVMESLERLNDKLREQEDRNGTFIDPNQLLQKTIQNNTGTQYR